MFGGASSAVVAHRQTADTRPRTAIENSMPVGDLHATIYRAIGIALAGTMSSG
jgi:hypothetical protein